MADSLPRFTHQTENNLRLDVGVCSFWTHAVNVSWFRKWREITDSWHVFYITYFGLWGTYQVFLRQKATTCHWCYSPSRAASLIFFFPSLVWIIRLVTWVWLVSKSRDSSPHLCPFMSDTLTSTIHELPDVGGGHQVVGSQVVCQLASNRHDDCHHQMGQSWHHAHLTEGRGERVSVRECVCEKDT